MLGLKGSATTPSFNFFVYVCTHGCSTLRDQGRVLDSPKAGVTGAGNRTKVLCKSSKCSELLSQPCSPRVKCFNTASLLHKFLLLQIKYACLGKILGRKGLMGAAFCGYMFLRVGSTEGTGQVE